MTFEVATRLAEGLTAVTDTQTYVDACRAVGYQHADLTARGAQVREWYAGEDGMDLNALDADCAALRAAAVAADDALRIEQAGMTALASAWQGNSGGTAGEFADRHCSAGAAVAEALRAAAATCIALRDNLWRLVDEKVTAALTIDDRCSAERAAWLAAARTVTTGAADQAGAAEIVKQKVMSYVDRDIRTDWVSAMRTATTSVSAAYDDAEHALNSHGAVRFEIPAQLGPPIPSAPPPAAGRAHLDPPSAPTLTAPAAAPATPAVPPALAPEIPTVPPPVQQPPAQPLSAPLGADVAPPLGAGPPSAPDVAGGLSGLVAQIIDSLGSLFDAPSDAAPDSADGEDSVDDGTDNPAADDEPVAEPEDVAPQSDPPEPTPAVMPPEEAEAETPEPAPVVPPAPATPPPAPAEASDDAATPCEIAADELPQVGQ